MTDHETTPEPEVPTVEDHARQKRLDWKAHKLRARIDKIMAGAEMAACVIALTDAYYVALAGTFEEPVRAGLTLLAMEHENRKAAAPKPEPSRIIVP